MPFVSQVYALRRITAIHSVYLSSSPFVAMVPTFWTCGPLKRRHLRLLSEKINRILCNSFCDAFGALSPRLGTAALWHTGQTRNIEQCWMMLCEYVCTGVLMR